MSIVSQKLVSLDSKKDETVTRRKETSQILHLNFLLLSSVLAI